MPEAKFLYVIAMQPSLYQPSYFTCWTMPQNLIFIETILRSLSIFVMRQSQQGLNLFNI